MFLVGTIHWPVTGDAALMHYVAVAFQKGVKPYSQIDDVNLPLSYFPEWLLTRLLGAHEELGWRLYDYALLALSSLAMYRLSPSAGRFAPLWAGCLYALVHGRDGIEQAGQRDLLAKALVLLGSALLLHSLRANRIANAWTFGLCVGTAACVKPTFALFLVLALADAGRANRRKPIERLGIVTAAFLLPLIASVGWLRHEGILTPFLLCLTVLSRFHASLGRIGIPHMLYLGISPLLPLLIAALAIKFADALERGRDMWLKPVPLEDRLLLIGTATGWLSLYLQGKGYL